VATEERQERQREARRERGRLPFAFAGAFSAILIGFAVIAVLLWLLVK
jgi:hypothetical protein